jgi:virulence-associated protein VagC
MPKRMTAKLLENGGSQAVRLPKESRLAGDTVSVILHGDRAILEPISRRGWSRGFLESDSHSRAGRLVPRTGTAAYGGTGATAKFRLALMTT